MGSGFPNSGKEWRDFPPVRKESKLLLGVGAFLPGKGNPRRSDFDDLNLFES